MKFYKEEESFKTYTKGAYFGEINVLNNSTRSYEAICTTDTELLSIERKNFREILNQYPEIEEEVVELAKFR